MALLSSKQCETGVQMVKHFIISASSPAGVQRQTTTYMMEKNACLPYNPKNIHPHRPRGRLVGATRVSQAKVYNKNGRAPGHLLLPNEFQKRLKSRTLIFLANQKAGFQELLELVR